MPASPPVSLVRAVARGLRKRCPRCGRGELFSGWHRLRERCPVCGLKYEAHTGDTWFFMYMTTAGLTGVLLVLLFLVRPAIIWVGQIFVALAAIAVIVLSLPYRKGFAVALDWLVERRAGGGGEGEKVE